MTEIQEVTKVGYDFRNQNGAGIWLPPNVSDGLNNLKRINPYLATAAQLYPVGAIGYLDQRKFAYAYCGGALAGWSRLVVDDNYFPGSDTYSDQDGFEGEGIYADYAAGTTTIVIEDTATRVRNYYQGGYLSLFNADGVRSTMIRIAASDIALAADNLVTLYLDDGIPWGIVDGDWCVAYRSPYSDIVEHDTNYYETFMGVSLCAVTATYFSWIQIAGPAWIAQFVNTENPGYTASFRKAYAHIDGTCRDDPGDGSLQLIGYVLTRTESTFGDTYIMLQLG